MNNFKQLIVDNFVYKVSLALIAILALGAIVFNIRGMFAVLFLYVLMGTVYADMYKKNNIKQMANDKRMIVIHFLLYILSYPSLILYMLAIFTLKLVIKIARLSTPKFGGRKKW